MTDFRAPYVLPPPMMTHQWHHRQHACQLQGEVQDRGRGWGQLYRHLTAWEVLVPKDDVVIFLRRAAHVEIPLAEDPAIAGPGLPRGAAFVAELGSASAAFFLG